MAGARGHGGGQARGGRVSRQQQRQNQKGALNSPWGDTGTTPEPWPEIPSRHPDWWQVHRLDEGDRAVLIAECRGPGAAHLIAGQQSRPCRISKANDPISVEIFSPSPRIE